MKTQEELIRLSTNIIAIEKALRNCFIKHTRDEYRSNVVSYYTSFYVKDLDEEWDCISYAPNISTIETLNSINDGTHKLETSDFDLSDEMFFQYSTIYMPNELEAIFVKSYLDKYCDCTEFYMNLCYYDEWCYKLGLIL